MYKVFLILVVSANVESIKTNNIQPIPLTKSISTENIRSITPERIIPVSNILDPEEMPKTFLTETYLKSNIKYPEPFLDRFVFSDSMSDLKTSFNQSLTICKFY